MDLSGFDLQPLHKTAFGDFTIARDGSGLLVFEMHQPGPDNPSDVVPISEGVGSFVNFTARTDLPEGAVYFDPNVGQGGAYWRCAIADDGTVTWQLDRPFWAVLVQSSIAAPAASINNTAGNTPNFSHFGASFVQATGLLSIGRRIVMTTRVQRVSGITGLTAKTELRIGGVAVAVIPWALNVVSQEIRVEMWVTAATTMTVGVVTAHTWTNAAVYASQVIAPADVTIAGLTTTAMGVEFGINETAVQAGIFKVVEASMEVSA